MTLYVQWNREDWGYIVVTSNFTIVSGPYSTVYHALKAYPNAMRGSGVTDCGWDTALAAIGLEKRQAEERAKETDKEERKDNGTKKMKTHTQTMKTGGSGSGVDRDILVAALAGYQIQLKEIEGKVMEVKRILGIRIATPITLSGGAAQNVKTSGKHRISAEGRARIAAAQKKRWAKHNRELRAKAVKDTSTSARTKKKVKATVLNNRKLAPTLVAT